MPKMVNVRLNPGYVATPETKPVYDALKAQLKDQPALAVRRMPFVSAQEAVKNSGGMYEIMPDEPSTPVEVQVRLEDMPFDQLKIMAVQLGLTLKKEAMPKADLVTSIRTQLAKTTEA